MKTIITIFTLFTGLAAASALGADDSTGLSFLTPEMICQQKAAIYKDVCLKDPPTSVFPFTPEEFCKLNSLAVLQNCLSNFEG